MSALNANEIRIALEEFLDPNQILTGDQLKDRYCHIWRMDQELHAKALVLAHSTEDVSRLLQWCNAHQQTVVTHGGLTNLVGSTETQADNIVLSLEKMNSILEVDEASRSMTVESGVILEAVQEAAQEKNLLFPLNFGAKGSAQIGGAISTNAGGLRVFRFGMTRQLILGLEVVLANGTVISSLKKIIKDNSGYDLKQLFIGAEGTLGVITKAVLKLVEAPQSRVSALVAVQDYPKVVSLLKHMDAGLAGIMSGYELMWEAFYKTATSDSAQNKAPLPYGFPYYVLIEALGSDVEKDTESLTLLLEDAMSKELIEDGTIATNATELNWLWSIREDVHVIKSNCHIDHHFDISLPIKLIGREVESMVEKLLSLDGVSAVYPFGHIADGNIHLIVDRASKKPQLIEQINLIVYDRLKYIGGSVSAEHGIGKDKKAYLKHCRSATEIALMQGIKKSLDPNYILNPGLIFD